MSTKRVNMGRPFCGLIVGHTECGKTFYLLKLLEEEFKAYFDYIYLLCPTFYRNSTYREWKYAKDHDFIPVECEEETFEDFLKITQQESMDSNTLIIIDDLASSKEIKRQASEVTKLTMHGRHEGLSVIILTQQYMSIAKSYREQISWIVMFCPTDEEDAQPFAKKYLGRYSNEKREEILTFLEKKVYAYILVQLRHPRNKFLGSKNHPVKEV